jgi:hypothetical protein
MAGEIDLKVSADIGDLRRQLESIPGITADQARLMVAELDRGFKKAEKAAAAAGKATKASMEQAEKATRGASDATKDLEDRFGKVGSAAGKLAGGLDLIAPGLGSVGRGIADLADVGEVASGSMGMSGLAGSAAALAAPLAVLALALSPILILFIDEKHRAEEAAAALARYEEATKNAAAANDELGGAIRDANDQLKIVFGLETQNEQAARKSEAALRAKAEAANAATQALIEVAKVELESIRRQALKDAIARAETEATKRSRELNDEIRTQTARIAANNETVDLSVQVFREKAKADDQADANAKRKAAREKAAAEATRRAAEAEQRATEALAAHQAMLAPLLAAEKQIESQRVNELEQSEQLGEKIAELAALKLELAAAGKLSAEEAAKFAAVEKAMASDLTTAILAEETKRQAGLAAIAEKAKAKAEKAAEERKAAEEQATASRIQAVAQVADVVAQYTQYSLDQDVAAYEQAQEARANLGKNATKAEKDAADERLAITRAAVRKAFLIDKAAKMASAAAATALAIVQALSSAPPPYNFIAAGAVGAAGLIQQAAIASQQPTFHAGGFVGGGMAPDEQQATVRRGEAVLSPAGRRAMGDDTIRQANAGMGGGQVIMVQQVYRHRVFDSFVRDNLRTRGPLSQALGAGSRAGQRRS